MSEASTVQVAPAADAGWAASPTDLERLTTDELTLLPGARPPYDLWCDAPTFCPAADD